MSLEFILCANYSCARAGWCKRISYKRSDPDAYRTFFPCNPKNNYMMYVKNKAREIYERDNPHDMFEDKKPEQKEHNDNYRQPGLWENNEIDLPLI